MNDLYIGLMSGTSADGIDAALVDFSNPKPHVVNTHHAPYSADLRQKVIDLRHAGENEIQRMGELDVILGKAFARAVIDLLAPLSIPAEKIHGIGSHGQTIRHAPHHTHRFTLQIGDPNIIAAKTNITTVADFRRKDMALSGQGAPLVPAFHQQLFASRHTNRAIVNIGGIANVTLLTKNHAAPIIGFDTGPGNTLIDAWIHEHQQMNYDANGAWARQGNVHRELLSLMLADSYFQLAPPKSTGFEYFHLSWLQQLLAKIKAPVSTIDVQATITELTAQSIMDAVRKYMSSGEMLICGGGVHNQHLMSRLSELAKPAFAVASTEIYGVNPDWVEAIAFAWLAKQTLNRLPGNLPSVTGASKAIVLGGVYYC